MTYSHSKAINKYEFITYTISKTKILVLHCLQSTFEVKRN